MKKTWTQTYAINEAVNAIKSILEALDPYIYRHSQNTAHYAHLLSQTLDLSSQKQNDIYYGALFHDIGKISVPRTILQKKDPLTSEEFEIIKKHPETGAMILHNFSGFKDIIPIVKHHHEWFDGSGYPDKLKNQAIPRGARIVSIADVYDALTTPRSYHKPKTKHEALEIIHKNASHQFDPELTTVFINLEKKL